jgi:hypothetical protein
MVRDYSVFCGVSTGFVLVLDKYSNGQKVFDQKDPVGI